MSLDRFVSRFERNREQARNTAKGQLAIIWSHLVELSQERNGPKLVKDAKEFHALIQKQELTPNQYSYIDGIYETTMKALGFPSVERHHDRPRATLRHPK